LVGDGVGVVAGVVKVDGADVEPSGVCFGLELDVHATSAADATTAHNTTNVRDNWFLPFQRQPRGTRQAYENPAKSAKRTKIT